MLEAVGGKSLVVRVAGLQHGERGREERRVSHAEGDAFQIQGMNIFAIQEGQHFVVRAILRHIIPRGRVPLAGLIHDVESEWGGVRNEFFVLRDVGREVGERTGFREVKENVHRARAVRLEVEQDRLRGAGVGEGQRSDGDLHEHGQFLPARARIRDDDLHAVDRVDDEFVRDELVEFFAALFAVPVAVAVEVLADEDRQLGRGRGDGLHFLVERDRRPGGCVRHRPGVEFDVRLARLERQVRDGEGEHRFGKVRARPWAGATTGTARRP